MSKTFSDMDAILMIEDWRKEFKKELDWNLGNLLFLLERPEIDAEIPASVRLAAKLVRLNLEQVENPVRFKKDEIAKLSAEYDNA